MRTATPAVPPVGRSIGRTPRGRTTPRVVVRRLRDALPEGRAIAEEVWQKRHRGMLWLLILHAPIIFVYAIARGNSVLHAAAETSVVVGAAAAAQFGPRSRRFQSLAPTFGLVMCSAILVHPSGGIIEIHFHYFFVLAAISLYHDWTPFLAAIGFVVKSTGSSA